MIRRASDRGTLIAAVMFAFAVAVSCGADDEKDPKGSGGSTSGSAGQGASAGAGGSIAGAGGAAGSAGSGGAGFELADFAGDWSGVVENQTFDLFGTGSLGIIVNADGSGSVTVDGGPVRPGPDPAEETFTFAPGEVQLGQPVSRFSPTYGNITLTIATDGTYTFRLDFLGGEVEGDGFIDSNGDLKVFFFGKYMGSMFATGRATLCKGGCGDAGTMVPPPPDCSMVTETMERGNPCPSAGCVAPEAVCVQGISECLQTCIPSECAELCQADENCIAVENMGTPLTFPDGRPLGGCTTEGTGPNMAFEGCTETSLCAAGSKCLRLQFVPDGICLTDCDTDADCPSMGAATGSCGDFWERSTFKKYCGLRCTPTEDGTTGDADCPANMRCVPSYAGGNCIPL